jgi:hypothetical protein
MVKSTLKNEVSAGEIVMEHMKSTCLYNPSYPYILNESGPFSLMQRGVILSTLPK